MTALLIIGGIAVAVMIIVVLTTPDPPSGLDHHAEVRRINRTANQAERDIHRLTMLGMQATDNEVARVRAERGQL